MGGQTIDEVENLIKKHEAFEKAAAAQEERFAALERLTTFELKELRRRQDENLNDRDKKKLLGIRPTDQTELIEDPKLVPLDLDNGMVMNWKECSSGKTNGKT